VPSARRQARCAACAVAVVALLAVGAPCAGATGSVMVGQAPSEGVTVTPAVGGPQTRFVFAFATPVLFGMGHDLLRYEQVRGMTAAPIKAEGCRSSFEVTVPYGIPDTAAGARVSAEARPGVGWCPGTYDAEVVEIVRQGCPLAHCTRLRTTFVARTFDRFTFTVT
jgi:hypothetical protein